MKLSNSPSQFLSPEIISCILRALEEDIGPGDVTTNAIVPPEAVMKGQIIAKHTGVVAGLDVAAAVYQALDAKVYFESAIPEGAQAANRQVLAMVSGPARALLTGERTALNLLGRMSGIATSTRQFVDAVAETKAVILDTRKTAPGHRWLDKYAVRMGGGQNHRAGLYDMVLIKDNHIDGAGGLRAAVERVRQQYGDRYQVEVEVKDLEELQIALKLPVNRIMLDNMDCETMSEAVRLVNGRIPIEASGNVTLATIRSIAETGVDFISSGALTHSAPVLDISMRLR